MSLRRALSLSALQTATSLVCAFASVKITSVYLGPAGIGVLGQLLQFSALMFGLISSGVNNGIVRWIARPEHDERSRDQLMATALKLQLGVGVLGGVAIAFGSGWLAEQLLHDRALRLPFLIFAAAYVIGLVGLTVFGGANANADYRVSTLYSIWSSVVGVLLFLALCPPFGTWGALVGAAASPVATAAVALWLARRRPWWPPRILALPFSMPQNRFLLAFVPAAAVSTVGAPLVQLLLRDHLAAHAGLDAVGFVQTITRLSDLYLGVLSTLFLLYYLRRFSEIQSSGELRAEVWRALRSIVPATMAISLLLYLARDLIILLLLTPAFHPMRDLFSWQMGGNVLRVVGSLFGYLITAKMHPAMSLAYQVMLNLMWWLFGMWLIERAGVVGAVQAYAAASAASMLLGFAAFWWVQRSLARRQAA